MTPRFTEVPESWKHPIGPYRKAPEEHGGEWWLVNPFTGLDPWSTASPVERILPDGYVELFGPTPQSGDFHGTSNPSLNFRTARARWEQDLRHFKQAGIPEWAEDGELKASHEALVGWNLGTPRYYEGRYGWMARLVESKIPDFEMSATTVIQHPQLAIAQYQIRLLLSGITPLTKHPFVPPFLVAATESE